MTKGVFYIITAPSGTGKTSLVRALVENDPRLCVSVSHTTRACRPGEANGVDYHFVNTSSFMDMLSQAKFLESAEVYGNHYGTSQLWVDQKLAGGVDVILEIDWQGAQQIRKLYPQACSIFILPPSLEDLKQRLQERAQDNEKTIDSRMRQAVNEITHVAEADYMVVNDDFQTALDDIRCIIVSRRLTIGVQQQIQGDLLASLSRQTV
jgi:guanylate kinase